MKHYICVEEHEITYVSGTYRTSGRSGSRAGIVIQDAQSIPGGGSLQDLFEEMEEAYNLAGKKVTLVLGKDLSCLKVKLPKSGERTIRRMARNELYAQGKCGPDSMGAVDIQRISGEKQVPAMVYYMEKEKLDPYILALEQAGMVHGGTLLMPDCAAGAARMLCKNHYMMIVDVEKGGLGLYAVSGGHCLAWRSSPLKAAWFCERKAPELLYDEIAEQAELIQKQVEESGISAMPHCLMLVGNCLPDVRGAAAYLHQRLKVPCIHGIFDIVLEPDSRVVRLGGEESEGQDAVSPGALAAIVAGSRRDGRNLKLRSLRDGERSGVCKGMLGCMSRGGAIFLLANLIAAAGVAGYMQTAGYKAHQDLLKLKAALDAPVYKKRYQSIQMLEKQGEEEEKRREEEMKSRRAVSGSLKSEDFQAFTDALEPGMEVKAVVYERGKAPYLEMTIFQNNPGQVPLYVERVGQSGVFLDVGHSSWEKQVDADGKKKAGVWATVRGILDKGERDEVQ